MALAIFIGISEIDANLFLECKGSLVPHGDGAYFIREVHRIQSASFAIRKSSTPEERFVAELRPCPPNAPKKIASAAVHQRIEAAFAKNEFTMKEI